MPKYKVSVQWQGNNEVEEYFDNEEQAKEYGFDSLADGCGEVIVDVELIEDENKNENEETECESE